jgi:hypothetical protein
MPSKKPTQPPPLDAKNMVKGGTPAAQKFPDWKNWVGGEHQYDGIGLRDVVNANAILTDEIDKRENTRFVMQKVINDEQAAFNAEVREALRNPPFPG